MEAVRLDRVGGIVLCGGKSTRMGQPKLALPFGKETLLARVVRIVGEVVSPVVVVAAPGQELPDLPVATLVTRDEIADQGPLGGLAAGLTALRTRADAAYVSSCDVPLLQPALIRALIAALGPHELAVPYDGEYYHPLAAVYRTNLQPRIAGMISQRRLRTSLVVEEFDARIVDVSELRAVDPDLRSLRNVNTHEQYRAALVEAGFATHDAEA